MAASQLRSAGAGAAPARPRPTPAAPSNAPRQRRRVRCAAATSDASSAAAAALRDQIIAELDGGAHAYELRGLPALIARMQAANPTPAPATASVSSLGEGRWEVFHAPHLVGPTKAAGVRLDPIRCAPRSYTYDGRVMVVNVRYDAPFVGKGWLCAAGRVYPKDDATLGTDFTEFWTDPDGALRPTPPQEAEMSGWDKVVRALGRASFLERFATFPVLFFDGTLGLFRFDPLRSLVAIRRVGDA